MLISTHSTAFYCSLLLPTDLYWSLLLSSALYCSLLLSSDLYYSLLLTTVIAFTCSLLLSTAHCDFRAILTHLACFHIFFSIHLHQTPLIIQLKSALISRNLGDAGFQHSKSVTKPKCELQPHLELTQEFFFRTCMSYLKITGAIIFKMAP